MTNPAARCFVSYKRVRLEEIRVLIELLRERGIPTWHDLGNLEEVQSEDRIRQVLSEDDIASGVIWITPEVASSNIMKEVEIPKLVARASTSDAFYIVPVLASGLDYEDIPKIVGEQFSLQNLKHWNVRKLGGDSAGFRDLIDVADYVLQRRVAAIHDSLPDEEPATAELVAQRQPSSIGASGLAIDLSHLFDGRVVGPATWSNRVLPAFEAVANAIEAHAPKRRLVFSGYPTISSAMALGATFRLPRGIPIAWRQAMPDGPEQEWSLQGPGESSPLDCEIMSDDPEGDSLGVLVSIADDVQNAFAASKASLPSFRALVVARCTGGAPTRITSSSQAAAAARSIVAAIRSARKDYPSIRSIHFFMAVPSGLAVLLGQLLNTLGRIHVYEHDPVDAIGRYVEGVSLEV